MLFTSLKTREQISVVGAPIWPAAQPKFTYDGKEQDVFKVPLAQCAGFDANSAEIKNLALVKKGRQESTFVDPANLAKGEFVCTVSWRALDRPWIFSPTWGNYTEVWNTIQLLRAARQYYLLCRCDHDRHRHFLHPGRLWFCAFSIPGPRFALRGAYLHALPARCCNHHSYLRILGQNWVWLEPGFR